MEVYNRVQKIKNIFFNPFAVKLSFIIIFFLNEIPLLMKYTTPLLKYFLLWAALYLIYDFIFCRNALKTKKIFWLLAFLISYIITIFINYKTSFRMNIIDYFYIVALMLVVYPNNTNEFNFKEKIIKEIYYINYIMILLTSLVALISIIMFLLEYGTQVTYDCIYPIGFVKNRLTGLYRNAIYPTSGIGLILAIVQMFILSKNGKLSKKNITILSICIVSNFIFICLANSRGNFIALSVGAFVLVFLGIYKVFIVKENRLKLRVYFASIFLAALSVVLLFGAIYVTRYFSSFLPPFISNIIDIVGIENNIYNEINLNDSNKINLNRNDIPEYYGSLTGRTFLWKDGLNKFLEKPILGYGAYTLAGQISIPNSKEVFPHFHNFFIQTLVSSGSIGFIIIFYFLASLAVYIFKYFIKKPGDNNYLICAGIYCLIAFLITINLADTTIMFMLKQSSFIFFTYLGYLVALTDNGDRQKTDKIILNTNDLFEKHINFINIKKGNENRMEEEN